MIILVRFGIVINFQNEALNLQGMYTLLKIHIPTTMINTRHVIYWGIIKNFSKKNVKDFIQKYFL